MSNQTQVENVCLKTADGELFDVDKSVAMEFNVVKNFFDDNADIPSGTQIPLPNISSSQLVKIIDYCKAHLCYRGLGVKADDDANAYDAEFVNQLDNEELKSLILAANYLNIKGLLDILCEAVANRITNRSVEYVRGFFGIENDFTPEEERMIRQQNAWAFQGLDSDTEI